MTSKIEYHCMDSCNNYGKDNEVTVTDTLDGHTTMSADTKCNTCGFEDYWEHSYFESGRYGYDKCKKYSFYN